MESATASDPVLTPNEPGLKANSLTFVDALAIGLNSTSPAYSLAAVLGPIVVLVGVNAPGVLIASFVPMLLIASAFNYLNKVDQDCGTTFSWVGRAMGPWMGWLGGWAIAMTGVLVVGSLADVAVRFTLLMLGQNEMAENRYLVMAIAVLVIIFMTWICVIGTQATSKVQNVLVLAQIAGLLILVAVALARAFTGSGTPGAPTPEWSWLNPFSQTPGALTGGLLLGVFAYWGWESAFNLSEETKDSSRIPGLAGLASTVILLITYVGTAIAVLAFLGPIVLAAQADQQEMIFATVAGDALGGWKWIVLAAVATSALASTQTTIIPASRTALSMARNQAIPSYFGKISAAHQTPSVSTWWVAVIAIIWYVAVNLISTNALLDSVTALSMLIAFYYSLTGLACAVYYRHLVLHNVRAFFLIGVGPVIGSIMLAVLLVLSGISMANPANSETGEAWLGVGPPLVIGIGIFVVGIIFMVASRLSGSPFWYRKPCVVDPALVPTKQGGTRDQHAI